MAGSLVSRSAAGPAPIFVPRDRDDIPGGISVTKAPTAAPVMPSLWRGPSSSKGPYFGPAPNGGLEVVVSILTVGDMSTEAAKASERFPNDESKKYRLVGKPDGLGALVHPEDPRLFILLVNHEILLEQGGRRAHGSTGAFVSRWEIRCGQHVF